MDLSTRKKEKILYLVFSLLFCSILMSLVDSVIQPQYFIKSLIKIVLFLGAVLGYFFLLFKEDRTDFKKIFSPNKRDVQYSLPLGVLVYAVIVGGYFLLRNSFDFSGITEKLTADSGVNKDNFLFVSLYISFVNSFLEELLFRAVGFSFLKKYTNRTFAYIFSALMFSLYHSGMTTGYFHFGVFALTLSALFIAGLFFNYLNEKSGTVYASWLVHAFANFGINTVGCILFGIL